VHTLDTLDYLAYWTWQAGDPVAARDLFATLERSLGPSHSAAAHARQRLAGWQQQVAYTRVFTRKNTRGWSEAARRSWRDGIS
jgi:hypothetical protein